ncbi:unnamed protein product [Prunus armeniaca]|uniref:Uncharacterized protein n=1 Tax=Prunus armeniaca TaxID=36596 RepID=A0A6J5VU46_PRUAR|nr:unnamed protein product [Prunus armeniaca]
MVLSSSHDDLSLPSFSNVVTVRLDRNKLHVLGLVIHAHWAKATTTILAYRRDRHRCIATFSPPPDPSIPPSNTLSTPATSLVSASIPHSMVTRAKDGIHKPNPHYAHHALLADSTNALVEPTSFSQANTQVE